MRYTFIVSVTDISYVDWFLLSKLFLKRILSSPLRVNMTNHNNTRWRVTEGDISKLIEFSKKKSCLHSPSSTIQLYQIYHKKNNCTIFFHLWDLSRKSIFFL